VSVQRPIPINVLFHTDCFFGGDFLMEEPDPGQANGWPGRHRPELPSSPEPAGGRTPRRNAGMKRRHEARRIDMFAGGFRCPAANEKGHGTASNGPVAPAHVEQYAPCVAARLSPIWITQPLCQGVYILAQ
jgi:hypothetical protein